MSLKWITEDDNLLYAKGTLDYYLSLDKKSCDIELTYGLITRVFDNQSEAIQFANKYERLLNND